MAEHFTIGRRHIGENQACFIVAEIGQAHDGSLGQAHAFIDAVAKSGADAVKFQTHFAEAESTLDEPWRTHFSYEDRSRFDYWKRMEFSKDQWLELKNHAEKVHLEFFSSIFSIYAFDVLNSIGIKAWKIPSGELVNTNLIHAVISTDKPIILSTGMSYLREIDQAVALIQQKGNALALLQSTSLYPTPPEKIGLNVLNLYRDRYGCVVGLSDHSGSIYPSLAALTIGAKMVELHITFDRGMFGPDTQASITLNELGDLASAIRFLEIIRNCSVDKDILAKELYDVRVIFQQSVSTLIDLPAGAILTKDNLTTKKPGSGIPSNELPKLIGRRTCRPVKSNRLLSYADIE